MLNKIPGRGYLLIAVLIFAASNSVTRRLTELGANNLIDGRNPISFCNVLFVGNLCALLALIAIYGKEWNSNSLSRLSIMDWIGMLAVAGLSGALAPAMFFFALEQTAVNNVVLIGRIEPPITLALSVLILKARVNQQIVIGAMLAFVGVILTILLQPTESNMMAMGGFNIGQGELMTAVGAIAVAISSIISKIRLNSIPLGIFTIFRTTVGTVIFFSLTAKLYGIGHFMDVFTPIIWQWMLLYGGVIVVGGQLAWFRGLKTTGAADVSLASSISPIAGIVFSFLILGEVPTMAHYIGGSVIILGIIFNQIGAARQNNSVDEKEMDKKVGFKGI
ncbi:EamA family transporter [Waterburya agarophytonicola K14]|uniref:EamA family transporter n=1 Tax=Waterburya agarophytonicola KI4 TaxID=2874699 RepID=A0A964BUB1_9CYAN|nr:DMT family transporter [Waterburya agarophytonicola]MCC0178643.1 EamA family transporter [Waterburya agarophytonicola KI4]